MTLFNVCIFLSKLLKSELDEVTLSFVVKKISSYDMNHTFNELFPVTLNVICIIFSRDDQIIMIILRKLFLCLFDFLYIFVVFIFNCYMPT